MRSVELLPLVPSRNIQEPYFQACYQLFKQNDAERAKGYAAIALRLAKHAKHAGDEILSSLLMAEILHTLGDDGVQQHLSDAEFTAIDNGLLTKQLTSVIRELQGTLRRSQWERLMENDDSVCRCTSTEKAQERGTLTRNPEQVTCSVCRRKLGYKVKRTFWDLIGSDDVLFDSEV